ncbi:hypothetical protein [Streptomyces luteireticuli]|uniref:Uncharacterized protein n=1 Tax=Streptomyces luteireticuli TaxID=173858 RepID=A0ABN0YIF1_9ACTN
MTADPGDEPAGRTRPAHRPPVPGRLPTREELFAEIALTAAAALAHAAGGAGPRPGAAA